ncbi:hypothetical protein B0H63DRAFT_401108 [Podospora didyma]|uniref:Uncharacterized protein n=1 Tax=Podospora didyma TaxID=330526 RepID=A0AAE0K9C0_9PEZI|nr:hypothetical protein B0H63DRAFT_401108 [Podospora didyma]
MNEDKDKKINNDKGKNKQPPQKPDNKDNNEDDEEKKKRNARALYFCTNKEDNAVAAVELDKDGMVSGRASIWKTGGSGAQGVDWKTKQSAAPDSLFSSSALVVVESLVFVVNSGSHTLSMLSIDKSNPLSLKKVGAPWKLPGEFPNTVTASKKHRMVCVGMTGSKAGIACAPYSPESGIGRMDGNNWREFKLDQKTPPVGPGNTVSQVFFSGDESQLYATVKGRPEEQKKGWFSAYDIKRNETNAWLGDEEHRSAPDGTAELFGSAVIPGSRDVLVADSSFGIAVLGMDDKSKKAYAKHKLPVKDQKATCKAAISPVTKSAWVSDAGRNRLVEVSYQNDDVKVVSEIELSGNGWDGKSGLGDLKAGGEYVYALGAGTGAEVGITIVHAPSKKQVQYADLRGVGAGKSSMGMALWWS